MIKLTPKIIVYLFLFCVFMGWGAWCFNYGTSQSTSDVSYRLPTIEEVQLTLGVEADGIIGPETIGAWKRYECDVYADSLYQFKKVESINWRLK